jgi:RNA polymerase sigma factor (sigma-70 family)
MDNEAENNEFFNKIYYEYNEFIYRKIKNILKSKIHDDIDSCVQDTFVTAWMSIEDLRKHDNIAGWFVQTAKNIAYNFNTKCSIREKASDNSADMENIAQKNDFAQNIAEKDALEKFIGKLSEDEQKLYKMKFIQDLSNDKIGKNLGISSHAAVMRINRLKEKFKHEFLIKK